MESKFEIRYFQKNANTYCKAAPILIGEIVWRTTAPVDYMLILTATTAAVNPIG